jgi:hypothetical protein
MTPVKFFRVLLQTLSSICLPFPPLLALLPHPLLFPPSSEWRGRYLTAEPMGISILWGHSSMVSTIFLMRSCKHPTPPGTPETPEHERHQPAGTYPTAAPTRKSQAALSSNHVAD